MRIVGEHYESIIKDLLEEMSEKVFQIIDDEVVISNRDDFYGGELYIILDENNSYSIYEAYNVQYNFNDDKLLDSDIQYFRDAVSKLQKIKNQRNQL